MATFAVVLAGSKCFCLRPVQKRPPDRDIRSKVKHKMVSASKNEQCV